MRPLSPEALAKMREMIEMRLPAQLIANTLGIGLTTVYENTPGYLAIKDPAAARNYRTQRIMANIAKYPNRSLFS